MILMSKIERTIEFVKEFVKELATNFGAKNKDDLSFYIFQNNTKEDALRAYPKSPAALNVIHAHAK